MSTDAVPGLVAVVLVTAVTLAIGTWGLRFSRTTSDFFVASRTVDPRLNASAIGGEYLSAASFLGIAGLLLLDGARMLWYPVGWTAGYLVLLVLVAAPLRRSGAYTLPDFAEARLASRTVRTTCSVFVVGVGWLYLLPQFEGAGITLEAAIGAPEWAGPVIVGAVVLVNVISGGMRSITFVQAFQYWLKLTALLVPAMVLLAVWYGDGTPTATGTPGSGGADWSVPFHTDGGIGMYTTYSLIAAVFLGTMGLPHVVVRFYTNPDGRAARRTTLVVLALLGLFYFWPPVYAALGRIYGGQLVEDGRSNVLVLELPRLMMSGVGAELLTGLVTAGAFAAFLSTASGLAIAVSGVLTQDVTSRFGARAGGAPRSVIADFRVAAVLAVTIPVVMSLIVTDIGVAHTVGLAFAVTASTFCPLLLLGIWWHGLTASGAIAGLVAGGLSSGTAAVLDLAGADPGGWPGALMSYPAAWSMPLAFATMIVVSLLTRGSRPLHAHRFLVSLHTPEGFQPERVGPERV